MLPWLPRLLVSAIGGLVMCATAGAAWGQEPKPDATKEQRPQAEEPAPSPLLLPQGSGLATTYPILSSYPLEMLGLLAPSNVRGPITLLPTITVSEEYNDNIFLDNTNKQADFITGFSPALMLLIRGPRLQLVAGYAFTAELYARESQFDNAFSRQYFIAGAQYEVAPKMTLSIADQYVRDRSTNLISSQGFTTGRQESWSNTITPGFTWQMTGNTTLGLSATYTAERFLGSGDGIDSDTYTFSGNFGYTFTPRFTGMLAYNFSYIDVAGPSEPSTTHNPTIGFNYRLTPTLALNVSGGPAFTTIGGESFVTPAGTANLQQRLRFGVATLQYTRGVSVAGGFGGTTDLQTVSASLVVPSYKDLVFLFSPAYSWSESVTSSQGQRVDVNVLSMGLEVGYRIAPYVSVFGGYFFVRQRTGGASALQVDADQNRVRVGLQFGYPINFE
jgi:hypothetical protein